jgi:hypothetical protein
MITQPTAVKLQLTSVEAAACALNGWSRTMICSDAHEDIDITIEFDYGDYVYHEKPRQVASRRMVEQWF